MAFQYFTFITSVPIESIFTDTKAVILFTESTDGSFLITLKPAVLTQEIPMIKTLTFTYNQSYFCIRSQNLVQTRKIHLCRTCNLGQSRQSYIYIHR